MRVCLVSRAGRFSPNSVEKDRAILDAVRQRLASAGCEPQAVIAEDEISELPPAEVYVSMGRSRRCLSLLRQRQEQTGALVVNAPAAVEWASHRKRMMTLLSSRGLPVAPSSGQDGHWVKRADGTAETRDDIVFVPPTASVAEVASKMAERLGDVEVTAHVKGDIVKFYGVTGVGFFRCYYPGDDRDWKFGDERHNGRPRHYVFDMAGLRRVVSRAARLTRLDIYGGDCVIRPDGQPVLIDFNDWPSFSRCREDAATAIARRIRQLMARHSPYKIDNTAR